MRELALDLWVTEAPLRFFGLEVGTRMTAIRLPSGDMPPFFNEVVFFHRPSA